MDTLESIARQAGVVWECIVIDDGSQDSSREILDAVAAKDSRFRIFHQHNQGLTKALIYGCQQARGEFIARHDCGDISLSTRFFEQARYLESNPDVSMVSAYTKFVAHRGESLYISRAKVHRTRIQNTQDTLDEFQMPSHHGCTMFRRDRYFQVGEYRAPFYFAQDLDLWSRLIEKGDHAVIPQVFYQAQFQIGSISGCYAPEQRKLKQLIIQATEARRSQRNESTFLNAAKQIHSLRKTSKKKHQRLANECYFIGSCLMDSQQSKAHEYILKCVSHNPFHIKGWAKLMKSALL